MNFLQWKKTCEKYRRKPLNHNFQSSQSAEVKKGFNRIVRYTGFVFDDKESIDPKVWKTTVENGVMLSSPNLRTKAGKAMNEFLSSFKRTNVWDVDRLLAIDEKRICGTYYPANLFVFNECLYIIIDSQFRDVFEKNNTDIIEITNGEITKIIDEYNK